MNLLHVFELLHLASKDVITEVKFKAIQKVTIDPCHFRSLQVHNQLVIGDNKVARKARSFFFDRNIGP